MGSEPSRQGDVYSYGILVLEMFTGKSPTYEIFKDGFNLHNFVRMALPERLLEIVDKYLIPNEMHAITQAREQKYKHRSENGDVRIGVEDEIIYVDDDEERSQRTNTNKNKIVWKCLFSLLTLGLACSEHSPRQRMNTRDVTGELQRIKRAFVGFEN